MKWQTKTTANFLQQLSKLDKQIADRIVTYFEQIDETDDPRIKGKALSHDKKGLWRYRDGDYRIICEIKDAELIVLALEVGHRSSIYRSSVYK